MIGKERIADNGELILFDTPPQTPSNRMIVQGACDNPS